MSSMASTSTHIVSSSSSSTPSRGYEVFLSFYGKDTRTRFTGHLHKALKDRDIDAFRDDKNLKRGEYFPQELLKAIQKSKYGIPVISENYAFSKWCLIELAEMVKCTELTVLPIFYHVSPSDVGNLRQAFATAFDGHEKDPKVGEQMISEWKDALKKVSKINGWHRRIDSDRYETEVIKEICDMISDGLNRNFSTVSKDFVGIESRVEEIMPLLSMELDSVRFIGLCGMGGIGKTTLSTVIYERVSPKFEASCFIKEARSHSLVNLQNQVISEILMERRNIRNQYKARKMIMERLRNKKVLFILDNVDGVEQLEALAGSHDWFGQGSRIIITSRDRHLLNRFVDKTYNVKVLNADEALQLFSWKAFKKPYPKKNYVILSIDIVSYAEGLPLALNVFGSMLFGRKMDAWESARDLLKENPNAEILDKLQISYDGLMEYRQKQLFLDIAFFFDGVDRDSVKHILESFGYYPDFDIEVLKDKSLITIVGGQLWMHDLLQKMGQKIVRSESPEEPGKRSRLCHNKDVIQVLKNDTGTDVVKGIVLKLPLKKSEQLNVEAFSKMKNLKMLEINDSYDFDEERDNLCTNLEWHGDPSNFMLSNELCVMTWWGYPLESLPANFQSNKLVELIMHNSCIKQLWVESKSFDKLKKIDLCHSQNLIETPDLSEVPNLEKLKLEGCTSLSKVHQSIGSLRRLTHLNLGGCSSLEKIPNSVGNITSLLYLGLQGTAIKKIPLESLNISNCSRLKKIPKNLLSDVKCLTGFYARESAIRIGSGLDPIKCMLPPNSLSSLRELNLSYCNLSDEAIPSDLSCLPSLRDLRLSGNKFTRISDSVAQLFCLSMLMLNDCSCLQALPKLPLGLAYLDVRNCPSLDCLYKEMEIIWKSSNEKLRSIDCSVVQYYIDYDGKPFKILHLHPRSPLWTESNLTRHNLVECGPPLVGSRIPEWFNDKSTNSSFGTIQLHSDLDDLGSHLLFSSSYWMGYAVFIVFERKSRKRKVGERKGSSNSTTFDGGNPNLPIFVCHFQVNGVDFEKPLVLRAPGVPSVGPNGFWVYIPYGWFTRGGVGNIILDVWRSLETSVTTSSLNVEVKECGARVLRYNNHDASELYQLLKTISPCGLDLPSYDVFAFLGRATLQAEGPIIM